MSEEETTEEEELKAWCEDTREAAVTIKVNIEAEGFKVTRPDLTALADAFKEFRALLSRYMRARWWEATGPFRREYWSTTPT